MKLVNQKGFTSQSAKNYELAKLAIAKA